MSAQMLRDAAKVLRGTIGTPDDGSDGWVIPGPWRVSGRGSGPFEIVPELDEDYGTIARTEYGNEAVYIATMHPRVGLALADWLDASASAWGIEHKAGLSGCRRCTMRRPNGHGPCPACLAEDVASAILGGEA